MTDMYSNDETWKAIIKEVNNDNIITPTYMIGSMFHYITNENQREYITRKYLENYWGLNNSNVEWYVLKKV